MSLIIAQVGNVAYTHTHINKPIEVLTRAQTHTNMYKANSKDSSYLMYSLKRVWYTFQDENKEAY